MNLPDVVTREEWLAARKELLGREKELTRARDALNADRRRLPMVEVTKDYVFEGPAGARRDGRPIDDDRPDGKLHLLDLFEGRSQLIVGHFMFDPSWEDGCKSCSAGADEVARGQLEHLHSRDTTLAYVSRAPIDKIERYWSKKGWTFPWYSSYGSDFNYDFHVTLDESVAPVEYNYRTPAEFEAQGSTFFTDNEQPIEMPGTSCFLRVGDRVFHTYSNYARGAEMTGGSYYQLDLTALGRQEDWEEPKGRADAVRDARPGFDD